MFDSLQPSGLQHPRLPCPSPAVYWCQSPSHSGVHHRSLLRLMTIELMMPSNHFILCHPLLLLPSVLPSIRVFSDESALSIRWPKYWPFSFNINPFNEHSGLISFRDGLAGSPCSPRDSQESSTSQFKSINSHIHT